VPSRPVSTGGAPALTARALSLHQLFGTLSGNTRQILHKFSVDLPKKHGRGGQSALRFSRLRMEARHNYVRKVAEHSVQHFITDDKVNVQGIVLAGSADFKTELNLSDMFDPRLVAKVISVVDVSYGGENGFNQVRRMPPALRPVARSMLTPTRLRPMSLAGHRARGRLAVERQVCPGEAPDPEVL